MRRDAGAGVREGDWWWHWRLIIAAQHTSSMDSISILHTARTSISISIRCNVRSRYNFIYEHEEI